MKGQQKLTIQTLVYQLNTLCSLRSFVFNINCLSINGKTCAVLKKLILHYCPSLGAYKITQSNMHRWKGKVSKIVIYLLQFQSFRKTYMTGKCQNYVSTTKFTPLTSLTHRKFKYNRSNKIILNPISSGQGYFLSPRSRDKA